MHSPSLGPGRIVLVALCATLACGVAQAGKLFKWVDANGVTHYSDVPADGAQSVTVEGAQSYHAPATRVATPGATLPPVPGAVAAYASVVVTAPADGTVLWNENGGITVAATLEPALAAGHHLWFVLDRATRGLRHFRRSAGAARRAFTRGDRHGRGGHRARALDARVVLGAPELRRQATAGTGPAQEAAPLRSAGGARGL